MKKKIFSVLLCATMLMCSAVGCGTDKSNSSSPQNDNTSSLYPSNVSEPTINRQEERNKNATNKLANNVFKEASFFYSDNPVDSPMIYGSVRNKDDKFGIWMLDLVPKIGDIRYIFLFDDKGNLESAIVWHSESEKKYVGCAGKIESIDEINANDWNEVLTYFGLTENDYTKVQYSQSTISAPSR